MVTSLGPSLVKDEHDDWPLIPQMPSWVHELSELPAGHAYGYAFLGEAPLAVFVLISLNSTAHELDKPIKSFSQPLPASTTHRVGSVNDLPKKMPTIIVWDIERLSFGHAPTKRLRQHLLTPFDKREIFIFSSLSYLL